MDQDKIKNATDILKTKTGPTKEEIEKDSRYPCMNYGFDGEVELQWFSGPRSLTLFISPKEISFLKAEDIVSQLLCEDGELESTDHFRALINWLQTGEYTYHKVDPIP